MDCSPPGSSVHGIVWARILEWAAMSSSRGSSRPRDWPTSFVSPALSGEFFIASTTWEVLGDPTGEGRDFGQKAGQQRDCPKPYQTNELCTWGSKSIVFMSPKGLGSGGLWRPSGPYLMPTKVQGHSNSLVLFHCTPWGQLFLPAAAGTYNSST